MQTVPCTLLEFMHAYTEKKVTYNPSATTVAGTFSKNIFK